MRASRTAPRWELPTPPPADGIGRLEIEVIGAGEATVKIDVADIAWVSGALQ